MSENKKKTITVSYKRKKRKNPRTFDFFESETLNTLMQVSAEIVYKIDEAVDSGDPLPNSIDVSTNYLYDISKCYLVMYEKLLKEQLIKSGTDINNTTLH